MPVWLEKDAPSTSSVSASFITQLATGVPLRPSTPAASGWSSPIWPFALNVVITGAPSCSASSITAGMWKRAPWPTTITGRFAAAEQLQGALERFLGRRDLERRDPALGAAGRQPLGRRQGLDLVGEDQVGDVAPQQRVLAGEIHQLDGLGVVEHGLAEGGDRPERPGQVDLLERARAEHLGVHLAGERQDRRSVDLRVPQAREQVGGARTGDREACRRPSGELAVGRRGERGRALVADADVGEPAGLLLAAQRVGEPEVGVADHPEHVLHPPVHHRLRHQVGDGRDVPLGLDPDEHLAVADLERVGDRLVVVAGGLAVERAVVVAVPGAAQQAVLDRSLAERPALVRAVVVERRELPVVVHQRDALVARGDGRDPALRQLGFREHPVPLHRAFDPFSLICRSLRVRACGW